MKIALALPGLHRVNRGAETAFESLAVALAHRGHSLTLFGTGTPRDESPYDFRQSSMTARERFEKWPKFPPLRDPFRYEELTWIPGLVRNFRPSEFDVSMTCSFPFTNLALRLPRRERPPHVFVTENGDWPALSNRLEYRLFSCDGIVCTNASYHERNREKWRSELIPNGVDLERFAPGDGDRESFELPTDAPVVLMVSALNTNKRVDMGIRAVAELDDAVLVVAGDGPLRESIDALGAELLGNRFRRLTIDSDRMPALYQSADAVLHTTVSESFGNVYVEAMASGVPLVGHRSAHTEWILGDSPLLVDTMSLDATVEALRVALSAAGRDAVDVAAAQRFDWSAVAERYETFLNNVVAERKAS